MQPHQYITITKTKPLTTLYYELGKSLFVKGDYNKAVEFLQKAFSDNTENEIPNSDILLTIATVYSAAGKPELSVKPSLLATTYSPEIIIRILTIIDTIPFETFPDETVAWILNKWFPVIGKFENISDEQKAAIHKFMGSVYQLNHDKIHSEEHYSIAGNLLHDRGKTFYWDGKYEEACKYFKRAAEIKKDFVQNYWYWADALYLKSYIPEKPYSDEAILKQADEVWQTGRNVAKPKKNDAWAYIVKERILTQQSAVDTFTTGNENLDRLREAWMLLEDALLLDDTSLNAWRDLANITRLLGLNQVSLNATHKALAIDPNYQFSLEDLTLNLIDIAETEKARELLYRFINDPKNHAPFYYSWLAISYFMEKKYKDAIGSINQYLAQYPEDDWALNFLMNCYWRNGKHKKAVGIADKILKLIENGLKAASLTQAFCFFIKGNIKQAIAIAEDSSKIPDQYLNALEDLQFYYLFAGDYKASENCLDTLLRLSDRTFQIKDILHKNELILKFSHQEKIENYKEINSVITEKGNGFISRIKEKIKSLETEKNSIFKELRVILDNNPEYMNEGSPGWIAATAAFARLTIEDDDPMKAFELYTQLKKYEIQLPDVINGFEKIAGKLFINGIRQRNSTICNNAIQLIKAHPDIYKEIFPNKLTPETIINEIYTATDDAGYYWEINAFLKDNSTVNSKYGQPFQNFFTELKNELSKHFEERFHFSYQTNLNHFVSPVIVELSVALIPETTEEQDNWSYIKNDIDQLRKTIQAQTGVAIPTILVRPNQYLSGFEYQFILEEIPIIRYIETPDTITEVLKGSISHLKIFLQKNLSYFINPDYINNQLQELKKSDSEIAPIIKKLFTSDSKKLNRFTKLIQRLLNEMVPVTDWKTILVSVNHTNLLQDDVHVDVREARIALKPYLPGNTESIEKIELNNDLKNWIINNLKIKNNKYYFTAPPNDTQDWLNNFREFISKYKQEIIIIIDDNDARPFLKKVVQLEFPSINIMAKSEIMNTEEIKQWRDKNATDSTLIDLPVTS